MGARQCQKCSRQLRVPDDSAPVFAFTGAADPAVFRFDPFCQHHTYYAVMMLTIDADTLQFIFPRCRVGWICGSGRIELRDRFGFRRAAYSASAGPDSLGVVGRFLRYRSRIKRMGFRFRIPTGAGAGVC